MMKAREVRRMLPALGGLLRLLVCLLALVAGNALAAQGGAGGGVLFAPSPLLPAAPVPPPFDITGFIQEATLDSAGTICKASDPRLAGGTLTINDVVVIVPCNTVLQMPAATLTWQELFSLAPRDIGLQLGANGIPTQTGLALKDTVTMPLTLPYSNGRLPSYEAHVQGNVVNGRYIAGLIFISQQNLNVGQGTITKIDYHNGELQIASAGPTPNIARVKINDPLGRFGLQHGAPGSSATLIEPAYDQRFSVDEESATIHAATGYPMCIPRSDPFNDADDPLCPQANRPRSPDCASLPAPFPAFTMPLAGQFCTSFMMPPPAGNTCTPAPGLSCPPDPTQQAPFEVGDFIDFQGTLKIDSKGPYISAHTIVNHAGIYTSPGIMPAYAAIEMQLQGTAALPVANLPQESTSRIKIEGFTTDPSNLVDIYALDVHPVTGVTSERLIGIANPSGPPVVGRFRFRPAAGAFMPPTREFRVVSRTMCGDPGNPCRISTSPQTYANGLIAGQYHAPNFEFIFPENLILGDAMASANFQDFEFLYCGSGPLTTPTGGTIGPLVGQLDPAPWAAPMSDPMFVLTLCPGAKRVDGTGGITASPTLLAPIAIAVATPASAASGQTVALSALSSSDPNTPTQPLSFLWAQTGGPVVVLNGANTASPTFKAPNVTAVTTLSFSVAVKNTVPLITVAKVVVSVKPAAVPPTLTFFAPPIAPTGSLVNMIGSISSGATFNWTQTAGPVVTLIGGSTITPSFVAPIAPTSITFVLTATTAAGASATISRTISVVADTVAIAPVVWDNRQGKGKLNIVATSSAIINASSPAGLSMTATFWNSNIAAGRPGSATSPITAPMSIVSNVPGQPAVCGVSALPCFVASPVSVIVGPASTSTVQVFVAPTTVVVKSSFGGSATATGAAITVR
jgi:hypothetical protein